MKVVVVTNIPAPYRIPVFDILRKKLDEKLTVVYCAKSEPNRNWKIRHLGFQHVFLKENMIPKKDGFNYVHNNIEILKHLKSIDPDIVITTGFNPTHIYAWLYTLFFKKKHITMTDGWIGSEKNLTLLHKFLRKLVYKTSEAFIGASKNSVELFKLYGIKKEKIFISSLCIENDKFSNEKSFKERKYDLMFSGQFIERKMPLFFAEIVSKVSKFIPDIKVLVLGEGPLKNKFFMKLKENHIDFHYAGFVSQEDLPSYYANAKFLLFPTKLDAWGIVVNEALASGTPVITTQYAGVVNDLLIHEINGFVLESDSDIWSKKIVEILSNEKAWANLSKNAKLSVERYNYYNAAEGILNACKFVTQENRK